MRGVLLAFDLGSKRIGWAASDSLQQCAIPMGIIHRNSVQRSCKSLITFCKNSLIDGVIFGTIKNNELPNGADFTLALLKSHEIKFNFIACENESFTSQPYSGFRQRDHLSAALILNTYIKTNHLQ